MPDFDFNPAVFRAYDIRGVADSDLTDPLVRRLGGAFATSVARTRGSKRIAVGRDCRLTSERLFTALTDGLVAAGADVLDIGVVPSPVLYFAAHHLQTDGAVIITGSHNPADDNGFKLLTGTEAMHSGDIAELRELVSHGKFDTGTGSLVRTDLEADYLARVRDGLEMGERRFPVVVDAGHGAGGPLAVELYESLGFAVTPLYCEMDGRFPAHHPDPTVEENLKDVKHAVTGLPAELGLALDGDADRLGAVDGRGRVLWGDQLMLLFGKDILQSHAGATFIAEVKCSQHLFDGLRAAGADAIMWKVGHSFIKAKMKETGALLAGEMSGHLFFADRYLGYDDGIYAGARLLELLSRSERPLAELYDELPKALATPEIRVPCPDEHKFDVVDEAARTLRSRDDVLETCEIDGVRAKFAHGWGLVRASNTQPSLVLRAEAANQQQLDDIVRSIEEVILQAKETI